MAEELRRVKEENARLRASINAISRYLDELDTSIAAPHTEAPSPTTEDPAARVKRLVEAYNDLKRKHEAAVTRYAVDYEKWRKWKQWVRGKPVSPRRERKKPMQKENEVGDVEEQDVNDTTLVEAEEPLPSTSDRPHTPSKRPLTPSRLEANSPGSPSAASALMNNALKAAASELETRRTKVAWSPLSKKSPARKFSTEPRNHKRKVGEDATPITTTKGKGRYAPRQPRTEKTAQNKPSFKYDEVVRNKQERRQLHGGDCECCRDYYEAIGPLPPLPQPPLWRTPPSSPAKHRRAGPSKHTPGALSDFDDDFDAEIAAHKKQISRHRHRWEAPKTPPGYWDIAFPDTQQVAEINRRADEMHARKRAMADEEPRASSSRKKRRS